MPIAPSVRQFRPHRYQSRIINEHDVQRLCRAETCIWNTGNGSDCSLSQQPAIDGAGWALLKMARGVWLFLFSCLLSPAAAQVAFASGTLLQPSGAFINDAQMRSTNHTLIIDIEGASFLDNAVTNGLSRNAILNDLFTSTHPATDAGYDSAWMAYFTSIITQAQLSLSRPLGVCSRFSLLVS